MKPPYPIDITIDNPLCAYCKGFLNEEIAVWGSGSDIQHQCKECKEIFLIWNEIDLSKGERRFAFTCNEFMIDYSSVEHNYWVDTDWQLHDPITLPYFPFDFDRKNEMYQKIKSYIMFS